MNNKIEKGCLAIVVNSSRSENLGKVVTVGNFIGKIEGILGEDAWEVDTPMVTKFGKIIHHQRESYLMRIDSYNQDVYNDEQIE
jgi:hypothetical protein